MEITVEKQENYYLFRLNGRLDINTSPDFEKEIFGAIEDGIKNMVIDCDQLKYITSAGLRVLNKTAKKLKDEGKIILFAMEDYVKEVFEIAGFDTFLTIVATKEDALNQLET